MLVNDKNSDRRKAAIFEDIIVDPSIFRLKMTMA